MIKIVGVLVAVIFPVCVSPQRIKWQVIPMNYSGNGGS